MIGLQGNAGKKIVSEIWQNRLVPIFKSPHIWITVSIVVLLLIALISQSMPIVHFVLGLLVASIVFIYYQQSQDKQLKEFSHVIQKVVNSKSTHFQIPLTGQDTLNQLGEDLNHMFRTLEISQKALKESESRFALATSGVADGLWEWHLNTQEMFYSSRWCSLLGLREEDRFDSASLWLDRIHPQDKTRVESQIQEHLEGKSTYFESEYRMQHENGSYHWFLSRGIAEIQDGKAVRLAGSLTDITKRGIYDTLTGLPNRLLLVDRIQQALQKSKRDKRYRCAVLFMDLNRFKVINDSLGHQVGDLLLIELAKRLQFCVRGSDTVARIHGDEFVIALEDVNENQLMQILNRIERYTASTFNLQGNSVISSASIGVVPDVRRYQSVDDILRDADIAMYRAKKAKLSYAYFDPEMHQEATRRQQLEIDMRDGLERGEFFLVYQPIVSLLDGTVNGFEALARWHHPTKGLISPDVFIPIAEETGLIVPLGEWVLREACFHMQNWQEEYEDFDLTVNVNLSYKQIAQTDFVDRVKSILEESRLPPHRLKFEITESAVVEDPERATEALEQLKELGVFICLDDFGTGYSSLSYIHSLPLDVVKIDRSFVQQMKVDGTSYEIVRSVTRLAHSIGLDVVSEGIETEDIMELLQELECAFGQGYLFSKPVSIADAKKLQAMPKMLH